MDENYNLASVQQALTQAFDHDGLRRFLRLRLNQNLDSISARGTTHDQSVFDVITAAQREGWLGELITQAKEENPNNYFFSILGDESEMQYDRDDISEIRIVLFGSSRGGTPGFIATANNRLAEIDDRIRRIEIVINDRATLPNKFFDSRGFLLIAFLLGLSALGSLVIGIFQVISYGP